MHHDVSALCWHAKSFTRLVVKKTANTFLGSVEEGRGHGVILPICTEQLAERDKW